jgi:hypothetical protein
METLELVRRKISIKTEDFFVFSHLIKEFKIKIIEHFQTQNRSYILIQGDNCEIELLREKFKQITNHTLIII